MTYIHFQKRAYFRHIFMPDGEWAGNLGENKSHSIYSSAFHSYNKTPEVG